MKPARAFDDLLHQLYDDVFEADGWDRTLAAMTAAFAANSAVITFTRPDRPVEGFTHGLPAAALRQYAEYYHRLDPWFAAGTLLLPSMRAARATDLVPEQVFTRTEFYCDFARGFGTAQALGGHAPVDHGGMCTLALHRDHAQQPFAVADVRRLERLLPHVQRATALRRRLALPSGTGLGFAGLDALALGVVIGDGQGHILFANRAAEAAGILAGRAQPGLLLPKREDGRRLAALIADVGQGGAGGALAAIASSGRRLLLLVSPLPPRFADTPGCVLITLRPAAAGPAFDSAVLTALFGLSPAEALLAVALYSGNSLVALARDRNVAESTLRTQLGQILRKTGTGSRSDLIRLLGLVPQLG